MTDVRLDILFGEDLRSLNANEFVMHGHAIVRDICDPPGLVSSTIYLCVSLLDCSQDDSRGAEGGRDRRSAQGVLIGGMGTTVLGTSGKGIGKESLRKGRKRHREWVEVRSKNGGAVSETRSRRADGGRDHSSV